MNSVKGYTILIWTAFLSLKLKAPGLRFYGLYPQALMVSL